MNSNDLINVNCSCKSEKNFDKTIEMLVIRLFSKFETKKFLRESKCKRTNLGFYVPFNSKGHIATCPQPFNLWDYVKL